MRYLFVYLHVCFSGRLCACLSCKTSLASLCRGHANWTVKKREDQFMFLCSPLTGAALLFYVSWWVWGPGLITRVTFIVAQYCEMGPDVCPHYRTFLKVKTFKWVRVEQTLAHVYDQNSECFCARYEQIHMCILFKESVHQYFFVHWPLAMQFWSYLSIF